jgi:hypothetical protein
VATARIWATLVEAAGGEPPPAAAPSLFRDAPPEVLSELYLTNGTNRFSLLDGDLQLLQESRFAPSEPDYFRARQEALRPRPRRAPPPPPPAVFTRLGNAFGVAPPLTGDGREAARRLERWLPGGGSVRVEDPRKATDMARRLALEWHRFVPDELPPDGESVEWKGPEKRRGRWRKHRERAEG